MGGYRTGLILAAPDFDTYNCLEKYAKHPSKNNAFAVETLIYRTGLRLIYEVGSEYKHSKSDLAQRAFNLRLGLVEGAAGTTTIKKTIADVHKMTDKERMDLYIRMCRNAGINISEEDIKRGKMPDSENK